jgi:hypothetical protein
MGMGGVVHNGVIVPDRPLALAEGTRVQIEVAQTQQPAAPHERRGGWWRGQVRMSPDFDELPADIRQALGMDDP